MINSDLKLVVPIRDDFYAYHNPISREVYEANFRLLRDTKVAIWGNSAQAAFAARGDAALYLKDAGRDLAMARQEEGDSGAKALLAELRRLTSVVLPGPSGWDVVPVEGAIASGRLDEDDWADAEASIVFFTCVLSGTPRKDLNAMQQWAASLLGGQTTSSAPMEWVASLPTSTEEETIATKAASSVPS